MRLYCLIDFGEWTVAPNNGSGLGFGIVQRLGEAHGGAMEFENVDGGWARFTVSLSYTNLNLLFEFT
jgi:signal transduction histidine kinase